MPAIMTAFLNIIYVRCRHSFVFSLSLHHHTYPFQFFSVTLTLDFGIQRALNSRNCSVGECWLIKKIKIVWVAFETWLWEVTFLSIWTGSWFLFKVNMKIWYIIFDCDQEVNASSYADWIWQFNYGNGFTFGSVFSIIRIPILFSTTRA